MKTLNESTEKKTKKIEKKTAMKIAFGIILVLSLISILTNFKNSLFPKKMPTIYEQFEVTEEEYSNFIPIFDGCGFTKITKVEKDDILNNNEIAFYVEMENIEPNKELNPGTTEGNIIYVYLSQDHQISEIDVNFRPVYKDGNILAKIRKYTKLDSYEKTNCQLICEASMNKLLKSPSTASFCKYSEYKWAKDDGIIKAQGYVDAQNSFGAIIRTDYLLTYDAANNKAISIMVDGVNYKFD